ncbi:MAG TPA: MFS transporter [Candidatus Hydrogenedentes bacterium]|nr:MFS transporter [Candidatus Hydrogenedentota bacterium]
MKPAFRLANSIPWAVGLCYGSMTCLAVSVNLPPIYLTTFSATFGGPAGLTEEQLGRIPAVVFAATVLGILVGGRPADRWGGKPLVMVGLGLTIAGLWTLAAAGTYNMLLVAGLVMGLGGGILDMILSPIVSALQPRHRARALNWLHAFYCVGALGTVLAGTAALGLGLSWRMLAVVISAVPIVMLLGFLRLRLPPLVHETARRTPLTALLRRPFFIAALAAIALCGSTEQGMAQWLPAYAERSLGYGKTLSGLSLALFSVGMIAGRFAAGSVAKIVRPLPMMVVSCAGCVSCYLIGAWAPSPPLALAACSGVGVMVSCLWPTTLSIAADQFPHGGASMFSLMAAAGNLGCFVTPWVIGVISQATSLRVGLGVATLAPFVLLAIVIWLVPHAEKAT